MRSREYGNLALKDENLYNYLPTSVAAPLEQPYPQPGREEREYQRQARERDLAEERRKLIYRRMYKAAGIQRAKDLALTFSLISIVVALAAMIMFKQMQIIQINFANGRIRAEIEELKQENSDEREKLLRATNLGEISLEATKLFGLRRATQNQRVAMILAPGDRTVWYDNTKDQENVGQGTNLDLLESYVQARSNVIKP